MDNRFWLATVAAFVTGVVLCFVFHGLILSQDYAGLQTVYRPPVFHLPRFLVLLLAWLVLAAAMAALYRFGLEDKPWLGQGTRFGLLAAGVSAVPYNLFGYVFTNITVELAIKQLISEAIIVTVMGLVIAWFYRK